jgi:hypothetical protein
MNITQSKNALAQCRSRTRLYETLAHECEVLGFDYDMSRSLSKNAAAARMALRFKAAELIGWADKLESSL